MYTNALYGAGSQPVKAARMMKTAWTRTLSTT
jgi:hypothetical protein